MPDHQGHRRLLFFIVAVLFVLTAGVVFVKVRFLDFSLNDRSSVFYQLECFGLLSGGAGAAGSSLPCPAGADAGVLLLAGAGGEAEFSVDRRGWRPAGRAQFAADVGPADGQLPFPGGAGNGAGTGAAARRRKGSRSFRMRRPRRVTLCLRRSIRPAASAGRAGSGPAAGTGRHSSRGTETSLRQPRRRGGDALPPPLRCSNAADCMRVCCGESVWMTAVCSSCRSISSTSILTEPGTCSGPTPQGGVAGGISDSPAGREIAVRAFRRNAFGGPLFGHPGADGGGDAEPDPFPDYRRTEFPEPDALRSAGGDAEHVSEAGAPAAGDSADRRGAQHCRNPDDGDLHAGADRHGVSGDETVARHHLFSADSHRGAGDSLLAVEAESIDGAADFCGGGGGDSADAAHQHGCQRAAAAGLHGGDFLPPDHHRVDDRARLDDLGGGRRPEHPSCSSGRVWRLPQSAT